MGKTLTVPTKDITELEAKAQIKITDVVSLKEATEYLSKANKFLDKVTAYRESKTKPLNEALKIIRAETKPIETKLEAFILTVRRKITDYQTEAKRIADEKAEKIAGRVKEGKGNLTAETASTKISQIEKPEDLVLADSGALTFKTMKKFEVMDMTLLPIEYHLSDDVAIRKAMTAGTELPGVRYYTEEVPINSR